MPSPLSLSNFTNRLSRSLSTLQILPRRSISNKSLKNILIQNKEVLHALQEHKLPVNLIIFFINKIILRFQQFLKKPSYL